MPKSRLMPEPSFAYVPVALTINVRLGREWRWCGAIVAVVVAIEDGREREAIAAAAAAAGDDGKKLWKKVFVRVPLSLFPSLAWV